MAIPPGADRDPRLEAELRAALAARGPDYRPRTRHLEPDGSPRYVNRLILEASPYLLQHAHNPVDWRPWGPEALAEARARDRPVFLSIGYATCHWCHVMEEESFEDEAVAAILNAHYVPVKMDREQHPALDQLYIMATQLQQGHAGWPLSIFLLPDGRPFHTGTYFPKSQFVELLRTIAQLWRSGERAEIEDVAARLAAVLAQVGRERAAAASVAPPGPEVFARALEELAELHNEREGGFSTTQQFPQENFLLWLLDHWRRTGERRALGIVTRTLDAIAAGAIHDHVGGGFHRYTVDRNWRTPHFEKMLYNQALLAQAFIEGWEATGNPVWRRAAERAFAYVVRDMTDAEGAFFAAEDADSPNAEGRPVEGLFYAWRPDEVRAVLGADADYAVGALGLDERPTIEAGPVPFLDPAEPPDFARLDPLLERLRAAREARPRPLRDEKVIAGWNGLMIRALAIGAAAWERPDLAEAAGRAAESVWRRLWRGGEGRLMRLWAGGRALEEGILEDYAWLGLGLLALWDASGAEIWRERAATLAQAMLTRFADAEGRLRMAAEDGPLGPIYESADGATPSGESSALELLALLERRLADPERRTAAERLRTALAPQLARTPLARPAALAASRILDQGESTLRRSVGRGAVRLRLLREGSAGPRLVLEVAEGWHVAAPDPGSSDLAGAAIEGARAAWPEGRRLEAGFAPGATRVLDGRVEVPIVPEAEEIGLRLQICSDRLCLAPEEARFRLLWHAPASRIDP